MHLLYCDESNLEPHVGDFLLYGGLMIDGERAGELSAAVDDVRMRFGVPRDHRLKFNPGPRQFSHEKFIGLKQEILATAHEHGARMLVYAILHDIARNADEARRNGINAVCFHFHCALRRIHGATGLVLIDRFTDEGNVIDQHLRDKFTVGLTGLPYSREMRLPNIVGFHMSAIGQSHFPSIQDIALGSLRFALNAHTRNQKKNLAAAHEVLRAISPLLWREKEGDRVPEIGLIFSPKVIKAPTYREQYQALKDFLAGAGVETEQEITGDRTY